MSDEALIEELARTMCKRVVHDDVEALELDWHLWAEDARAILPIIRRREIEAGEKVKEVVMPYIEDIAALTEDPTYDPLEVGFRHSPLPPAEIRNRYARACAWAWQDTQNAIRALDVAAIIGGEHD